MKPNSPHVVHSRLPVVAIALPCAQSEHRAAPAACAYVPGWQSAHGAPTVELEPAKHEAHSMLFPTVDSRPAGQLTQVSPPELTPRPSSFRERKVTYEPHGQPSHCAAPSELAKVPIGHGRH